MQTFYEDCFRDTIQTANKRTASFDETKDAIGQICSDLIPNGLPESCQKYLDPDSSPGSVVCKRLFHPAKCCPRAKQLTDSGLYQLVSATTPPVTNARNLKARTMGFFSITSGGGTDGDFDTQYDTAVTDVSLILTVVWAKRQNAMIDP